MNAQDWFTPVVAQESGLGGSTSALSAIGPRWAARLARQVVALVAVAGLCALARPYRGVTHDAILYVGRALADLGVTGYARDPMFVHDGQSGLSIFSVLLRALVERMGVPEASITLAALAGVGWFAAMAFFARSVAGPRLVWAILAVTAVAPSTYGGFGVFRFAETIAVPRPFAEAAVIAALAAFVAGRQWLSFGLLALSAAVHPIMALAGLATLGMVLCLEDRRWLKLGLVAFLGLVVGAVLGLPILDRLLRTPDPAWEEALRGNAYLFPSLWPSATWATVAVQVTTLGVAAHISTGRVRRLLLAVIAAGLGGVLLSAVCGDLDPLLLVVQAQPWRALWLVAALSPAALVLCFHRHWKDGAKARLWLAALAVAWIGIDDLVPALSASAVCVLLCCRAKPLDGVSARVTALVWGLVALYAAAIWVMRILFAASILADKPREMRLRFSTLVDLDLLLAPSLVILVAVVILARRREVALLPAGVAAAAVAGCALLTWDDRSATQRALDLGRPDPALLAQLAGDPGAVLWIGGSRQAWTWAARPNWASPMQRAGIVFSREIAILTEERFRRLIRLRFATEGHRAPFKPTVRVELTPTAMDLSELCASADAPAWIVGPLDGTFTWPTGVAVSPWQAPARDYALIPTDAGHVWHRTGQFGIVGCAQVRGASTAPSGPGLRPSL